MTKNELLDACKKFGDYLEANGLEVDAHAIYAKCSDGQELLVYGPARLANKMCLSILHNNNQMEEA